MIKESSAGTEEIMQQPSFYPQHHTVLRTSQGAALEAPALLWQHCYTHTAGPKWQPHPQALALIDLPALLVKNP